MKLDEMIRPQEELSGALTTIRLTKIYRYLNWKNVHFQGSVFEGVFFDIYFTNGTGLMEATRPSDS